MSIHRLKATEPQPRSPARQKLARAIDEDRESARRLEAVEATLTKLRVWELEEKVAAAGAAVEDARSKATQYALGQVLGETGAAPVSVREARDLLGSAEDELDLAKSMRAELLREKETLWPRVRYATNIDHIREVVRTDTATDTLLHAFAAKYREFLHLRAAVHQIQSSLTPEQEKLISAPEMSYPLQSAWHEALKALETDPDAPLPTLDAVTTEPPRPAA